MKYTLHIDPDREEEVVIYARAKTPEVEALIGYVDRMNTELLGYGEGGQILPLHPSEVCCFTVEEGRVYALTDREKLSIRFPLYVLEDMLDEDFIRINQSCLGNIRKITCFDTSIGGSLMVTFQNKYRDYVSRRQLKAVKERMGIKK